MTFGRIVFGSDGTTSGEALVIAAALAKLAALPIEVVHAGTGAPGERERLDGVATWMRHVGVPAESITTTLRAGKPADVVAEVAEELDAGLMIVGRGGERPSHLVQRLAHHAPCDLLVVHQRPHDDVMPYGRIAIATDGSATADRAARRGYDLANVLESDIDLIFVGHPATGELISQDTIAVYAGDAETTVHLLEGEPAQQILEAATQSDLIVVGNKGLTGLRGFLPGIVPRDVLDGAGQDVLVCRTVRPVMSQLERGEGAVIERHGEQLAAFVDDSGEVHTMSARCTHVGCVVEWNPADRTFDCPCHGSRFDATGLVIHGPAARPLPPA